MPTSKLGCFFSVKKNLSSEEATTITKKTTTISSPNSVVAFQISTHQPFSQKKKHHQQSRPTVSLVVSTLNMQHNHRIHECMTYISKKSPTGPTERTPKKPEYLIARSQLTKRGPLVLVRPHSNLDGLLFYLLFASIYGNCR